MNISQKEIDKLIAQNEVELSDTKSLIFSGNTVAVKDYSKSPPEIGTPHQFDFDQRKGPLLARRRSKTTVIFGFRVEPDKVFLATAIIVGSTITLEPLRFIEVLDP